MRGAERPGNVKWSQPFFKPLEPLPASASLQIFFEMAEEPPKGEEAALDELLQLSGSLPLAVSLMANVVSFEGYSGALSRWHEENTTLLSNGHHKSSNLEKSIVLSLKGPRMSSSPHARDLLSLLSLLPDGITVKDLLAADVPIPQIGQCASFLIQTSLAYVDTGGRIKCLVPIREYVRKVYPPSLSLCRPLRTYLERFISMWETHKSLDPGNLASTIQSSLGNINELLLQGLSNEGSLLGIVNSFFKLSFFSDVKLRSVSPLMEKLHNGIKASDIPWLKWRYRCRQLHMCQYLPNLPHAEVWINEGLNYFSTVHCPIDEGNSIFSGLCFTLEYPPVILFYDAVSRYYVYRKDFQRAIGFNNVALALGKQTIDSSLVQRSLLCQIDIVRSMRDPYSMLRLVKEARELPQLAWSTWSEISWQNYEAQANWMLGNLLRAHELSERHYKQLVRIGMDHSERLFSILDLQADIYLQKTEYLEAKKICKTALTTTDVTRSTLFYARFLVQNAYIGVFTGSTKGEILSDLDTAEAVYRGLGCPRILLCSWVRAELELHDGHFKSACAGFQECLFKSLGVYPDILVSCLAALGDPRHKMDTAWNTLRWAMIYLALVRKMKDLVANLQALRRLADLFVMFNDEESALNLFNTALEGATNIDIHQLRAECMAGIGDIMSSRDNMVEAKEMWEAAHPLFVRSSQTKAAIAIKARLEKISSAGDNQEDIVESPEVCHDAGVTANQEESKKLAQLALLFGFQNFPSAVAEGSMQPPSPNGSENAIGESHCTIQYLFRF